MKKVLLFACSICLVHSLGADNHFGSQMSQYGDDKKFSFSFNAGVGIPLLDFGKKVTWPASDSTHAYGFANPGFHFQVVMSYRFIKYVGIAARMGGSICSFDVQHYTAENPNSVPPNFTASAYGSHFVSAYMGGLYLYYPFNDQFSVESKILFGSVFAHYPDITVTCDLPNNNSSTIFKLANAKNFGYNISIGCRYRLDELLWILGEVSYTGANLQYEGETSGGTLANGIPYTSISDTYRSMQLGILTITGGFAITF